MDDSILMYDVGDVIYTLETPDNDKAIVTKGVVKSASQSKVDCLYKVFNKVVVYSEREEFPKGKKYSDGMFTNCLFKRNKVFRTPDEVKRYVKKKKNARERTTGSPGAKSEINKTNIPGKTGKRRSRRS